METDDIDIILTDNFNKRYNNICVNFLGVFAWDEQPSVSALEKLDRYPAAFVFNSDPSTEPGEHWLAVYIPSRKSEIEFFDSFGKTPAYYSFPRTNKQSYHHKSVEYSCLQLQSINSTVCGHYCITFLKIRPHYLTFAPVIKKLRNLGASSKSRDSVVNHLVSPCHLQQKNAYRCTHRNCCMQCCKSCKACMRIQ